MTAKRDDTAGAGAAGHYSVWGPELSPFVLKLEAMLRHAEIPFRRLPRDGSRALNMRTASRLERAKKAHAIERFPHLDPLDEYPLVPFLVTPEGSLQYDTSSLAHWIDAHHRPSAGTLFPAPPALHFVAQLIDEAFDEFGLYMVHHYRWKVAAVGNDPGQRLAREMAKLLPPGSGRIYGRWFARRQVRRLPYLFSVAPVGYSVPDLADALTPPARRDFPPTHDLLEEAWQRTLAALEELLAAQPYVLGERFTIADASVYGQLSMNLTDPAAADLMRASAPRAYDWLVGIRDGAHVGSQGALALTRPLRPLLAILSETFLPLMRQNAAAHRAAVADGETLFNEAAFDRYRALYDGELLGRPYRAVVKTFQVRVWNELRDAWGALSSEDKREVSAACPGIDALTDI